MQFTAHALDCWMDDLSCLHNNTYQNETGMQVFLRGEKAGLGRRREREGAGMKYHHMRMDARTNMTPVVI